MAEPAAASFRAIGTSVSLLVVAPEALAPAEELLRAEIERLDRACSRFRSDSELARVQAAGAAAGVPISPLLADLVAAALHVAELTDGMVDPTVGAAVAALGYDRDFAAVPADAGSPAPAPVPAPGWRSVGLDAGERTLRLPRGVSLDLGSSAKALAADRAAALIAGEVGCGVLVNLGGDIAVAGEPPAGEGWRVGLDPDSSTAPGKAGAVVAVRAGGLASSGTAVRTWRRGGRVLHHIVDPRTGDVAASPWVLVSVAAGSCLVANAGSTAAMVLGEAAPAWLAARGLPARLVRPDGRVVVAGGWPADHHRRPARRTAAPPGRPADPHRRPEV